MGNIKARPETNNLFFDFRYKGKRCREQTTLPDLPANRKRLNKILKTIEAEITLGTFNYEKYFPDSRMIKKLAVAQKVSMTGSGAAIIFKDFAAQWLNEKKVEWRSTQLKTVKGVLDKYLIPQFGNMALGEIGKDNILNFRTALACMPGRKAKTLSSSRINHIMAPLRMIVREAANRFGFTSSFNGIKSLKVPKTDVHPFTLEEMQSIINTIRPDYRNYMTTRFLTGMRTSEIGGLQWKSVDFDRHQILIHKAFVDGELIEVKNDGSYRAIDMSRPVFDALLEQKQATGQYEFVFCNSKGRPINHNNFTRRIWYHLLAYLKILPRRPYQTRHTAATLWLAAGENPEWIARQMGHTTTAMLFTVYSRFVPNLTRQDGSAFESLLANVITKKDNIKK